jgi:hypothetical protein
MVESIRLRRVPVSLDGEGDPEAGLAEAISQTAGAGEQVDRDWTLIARRLRTAEAAERDENAVSAFRGTGPADGTPVVDEVDVESFADPGGYDLLEGIVVVLSSIRGD